MKNKKYLLIPIIVISFVLTILILNSTIKETNPIGGIYSDKPYETLIPADQFQQNPVGKYITNPQYNHLTDDYRPRWDSGTDAQFVRVFQNLPKMPQDFYRKYDMFFKGTLTDYDRLGPEYWKQPEWYGLNDKFYDDYINRSETHWRIGEISCRPSTRNIEIQPGNSAILSTYMYSSILGSEAYLGVILFPFYPETAMTLQGKNIFTNPSHIEKYVDISIVSPENNEIFEDGDFQQRIVGKYTPLTNEERFVLFPPTYTIVDNQGEKILHGYPENWCYKVELQLTVKSGCPKGNYVVALDARNPPSVVNEEFMWLLTGNPYYSFYFNGIRTGKPVAPYFQIVFSVI